MDLRRAELTHRRGTHRTTLRPLPRRSARWSMRRAGAAGRRAVDGYKLAGFLLVVVGGTVFWAGAAVLLWWFLT